MEDSSVFFHALAYIAFIVLSGIAFLVCFILFVVRISQNHQHRWNWLFAGIGALLLLLFSIFLFVNKAVQTAKNLGERAEKKFEESIEEMKKFDSSYQYNKLNTNEMAKKLKEFETLNKLTDVPKEFYVYYGFADYYRMPITYPYSLHCTDVLETATLFNERNVTEFNVNDNGEIDEDLADITDFAFDNSVFIAKTKSNENPFTIIWFRLNGTKAILQSNSQDQAFKLARKNFGYRGYDTLISVLQYNQLFK